MMIDPPSLNSGNAFWTVNSVLRVFRPKAASKCSSVVSWGGRSEWQLLSSNHRANLTIPDRGMVDYVIADFDGDGTADFAGLVAVANANGQGSINTWEASLRGRGNWTPAPGSQHYRTRLRSAASTIQPVQSCLRGARTACLS
jgi:hypothetical protein